MRLTGTHFPAFVFPFPGGFSLCCNYLQTIGSLSKSGTVFCRKRVNIILFQRSPKLFYIYVVRCPATRPSMLILTPSSWSLFTYTGLVNWLPWSELIISGTPCSYIAASSTPITFSPCRLLWRPQPTIKRQYTSMIAVKYMKPLSMGMYVMSISQTWLGRSILGLRNK